MGVIDVTVFINVPGLSGALDNQTFDERSGDQTYDASVGFTGVDLTFTVTGPAGVTINELNGVVTHDTQTLTAQTLTPITVRATQPGGVFVESIYLLTINDVPATAPAQADPPILTVDSASQITVTYGPDPDDGGAPISFRGHRFSTDGTNWTFVTDQTSPIAQTGLNAETLYYFQRRVTNSVGTGPWSTSANATTLPLVFTVSNINDELVINVEGQPDDRAITIRIGSTDYTTDTSGNPLTVGAIKAAPMNLIKPVISGDNEYGATLTITPGYWIFAGADPGDEAYQWRRNAANFSSTALSRDILYADLGFQLDVVASKGASTVTTDAFSVRHFLPTDASSCVAWFDASDLSTLTTTGNLVDAWANKISSAGVTSAGTDRPASGTRSINGLNALDFTGTNWMGRSDAFGLTGNSGLTVIVIAQTDANSGGIRSFASLGSSTNPTGGQIAYFATGTDGYSWRFNNGNRVFGSANLNTAEVLSWNKNATDTYADCEFRINGGAAETQTSVGSGTNTLNLLDQHFVIGDNYTPVGTITGTGVNVAFGELMIFNVDLGNANNAIMNAALRAAEAKWAISTDEVS